MLYPFSYNHNDDDPKQRKKYMNSATETKCDCAQQLYAAENERERPWRL